MSCNYRILIISFGSIGKRHLRNTRNLLPNAQIAVYRQHTQSDCIPDGADFLFDNIDDALEFCPDAVIISSPANQHINNTVPFLERNIPVFIEKPLAADFESTKNFIGQANLSNAFVMVGYVLRFLPTLHDIRSLLKNNFIGEVRTAHIQVGQYLPDWRPGSNYRSGVSAQAKLGGGALLELSHELDYAVWLFGLPESIMCSKAKLSDLDIDVEDSAHIILEYTKKRVIVQLDFLQRVANMELQIVGSEGTLKANLIKEEISLFSIDNPNGKLIKNNKSRDGNEIYLRQFDFFFYKCFQTYKAVFPGTEVFEDYSYISDAGQILRLVDLAKLSDKQGARKMFLKDSYYAA